METFLAKVDDVPEKGSFLVVLADGSEVVLFKQNGKIWGLNNSCPHMGGPLSEGEVEGSCITCPWHGYQFDFKTGDCINMPGYTAERADLKVTEDSIYLLKPLEEEF
jgi:nitrite reductase (NADH) small subunit